MPAPPLVDRLRAAVGIEADTPHVTAPRAAVLLLADPGDPCLPLLFVRRSQRVRFHQGQIAFPGGSAEPGETAIETALREAREEVGLSPDNVEVLGHLQPLHTAISGLWLTPVVGLQRRPWAVAPDDYEVAEHFRIGLDELMRAPHEIRRFEREGVSRDVHFYTAGDRVIWGVSGTIVHDLLARLGRSD